MKAISGRAIVCLIFAVLLASANVALAEGEWAQSGNNIYSTNTGNVGIGTMNPGSKLEIKAVETPQDALNISANSGPSKLTIRNGGNNDMWMSLYDPTGVRTFELDSVGHMWYTGGDVGIGTTSPGAKFDVYGLNGAGNKIDGLVEIRNTGDGGGLIVKSTGTYPHTDRGPFQVYYGNGNIPILNTQNNGNVGIGTSRPNEKLSIAGNIEFQSKRGQYHRVAQLKPTVSANGSTDLGIWTRLVGDEYERMTIKSNGNVGIGTTVPGAKLDVYGSNGAGNKIDGLVEIRNTGDGSGLIVKSTGTYPHTDRGPFQVYYGDGNIPILTTQNNGNVGIGTTTPQSKLAVNGTITAKEIKVTEAEWSDFVFDETYELPSLSSIESYIKKNKRLPEIPSAEEVKELGLDVSEMLAKQMQKIEELTLYLIELKKENDRLKERVVLLEGSKKPAAKKFHN